MPTVVAMVVMWHGNRDYIWLAMIVVQWMNQINQGIQEMLEIRSSIASLCSAVVLIEQLYVLLDAALLMMSLQTFASSPAELHPLSPSRDGAMERLCRAYVS